MPVVGARTVVPRTPDLAFAVPRTRAPVRCRWDPFVRSQRLLGADRSPTGSASWYRVATSGDGSRATRRAALD